MTIRLTIATKLNGIEGAPYNALRMKAFQQMTAITNMGAVLDIFASHLSDTFYDKATPVTSLAQRITDTLAVEFIFQALIRNNTPSRLAVILSRSKCPWVHGSFSINTSASNPLKARLAEVMVDPENYKALKKELEKSFGRQSGRGSKQFYRNKIAKMFKLVKQVVEAVLLSLTKDDGFAIKLVHLSRVKTIYEIRRSGIDYKARYQALQTKPFTLNDADIQLADLPNQSVHAASVKILSGTAKVFDPDFIRIQGLVLSDTELSAALICDHKGDTIPKKVEIKLASCRRDYASAMISWKDIDYGSFYHNHALDFRGRVTCLATIGNGATDFLRIAVRPEAPVSLGEQGLAGLFEALASALGNTQLSFLERVEFGRTHQDAMVVLGKGLTDSDDAVVKDNLHSVAAKYDGEDYFHIINIAVELFRISQHTGPLDEYLTNVIVPQDATQSALQHMALLTDNRSLSRLSNVTAGEAGAQLNDGYRIMLDLMNAIADGRPDSPEKVFWIGFGSRKCSKKLMIPRLYGASGYSARQVVKDIILASGVQVDNDGTIKYQGLTKDEYKAVSGQVSFIVGLFTEAYTSPDSPFGAAYQFELFTKDMARVHGGKPSWDLVGIDGFATVTISENYDRSVAKAYKAVASDGKLINGQNFGVTIGLDTILGEAELICNLDKAVSGIAPNYIHSYDALILHLIIVRLKRQGIDSIPCHDCISVQPRHLNTLRAIVNQVHKDVYLNNTILADWAEGTGVEVPMTNDGITEAEMDWGVFKWS